MCFYYIIRGIIFLLIFWGVSICLRLNFFLTIIITIIVDSFVAPFLETIISIIIYEIFNRK